MAKKKPVTAEAEPEEDGTDDGIADDVEDTTADAAPEAAPVVENEEEAIAARAAEVVAAREARTLEERIEPGSVCERTPSGWAVRMVYGGAVRLFGEGETLATALRQAGV